jgi:hypothetical protein
MELYFNKILSNFLKIFKKKNVYLIMFNYTLSKPKIQRVNLKNKIKVVDTISNQVDISCNQVNISSNQKDISSNVVSLSIRKIEPVIVSQNSKYNKCFCCLTI